MKRLLAILVMSIFSMSFAFALDGVDAYPSVEYEMGGFSELNLTIFSFPCSKEYPEKTLFFTWGKIQDFIFFSFPCSKEYPEKTLFFTWGKIQDFIFFSFP
jgi:hypothetical protein